MGVVLREAGCWVGFLVWRLGKAGKGMNKGDGERRRGRRGGEKLGE